MQRRKRWLVLGILIGVLFGGRGLAQEDNWFNERKTAIQQAIDAIAGSVVRIETFASLDRVAAVTGTGPTTGIVVSPDGLILSSAFNFAAKPESILVTFPGGQRVSATIQARDHNRQLVLLKADFPAENFESLPVPTIASKADLRVGQTVIAVGRTLNPEYPNVSTGIISARDRIWGKAVQTDAKISPNNYGGPLIDLWGRAIGILVPLSPQGGSEFAGAEWYDSGIGFAVPLEDVMRRFESLRNGEDLHSGLMGIALKGNDLFGSPPEIAVCRQRTPAYDAGIRVGDVIVEIDGMAISRQSQLKHALGPLYAGDIVHVVVERDDKKLSFDVTLTDKLVPYAHPFIGILPVRDIPDRCVVRYVYAGSPADKVGIQAGDRIVRVDDFDVTSADALRERVTAFEDAQKVTVVFARGEEELAGELILAELPVEIPKDVPLGQNEAEEVAGDPEFVDVKLPEEAGTGVALIPKTYNANRSYGLVVDLFPPGEFTKETLRDRWATLAEKYGLIVLAPQPKDPERWLPTETEFVKKLINRVADGYAIDPHRTTLFGVRSGGSMAFLTTFQHRDVVRGLVVVDSPIGVRNARFEPEPENRLAVLAMVATDSKHYDRLQATLDMLKEQRFPVTEIAIGKEAGLLKPAEVDEVCRWIDTLDRI